MPLRKKTPGRKRARKAPARISRRPVKMWLVRDEYDSSSYDIFREEPSRNDSGIWGREWQTSEGEDELFSFCSRGFEKATGIKLPPKGKVQLEIKVVGRMTRAAK